MRAPRRRSVAGLVVLVVVASAAVAVAALGGGASERAAPSARAYPTVPALGAPRESNAAPAGGRGARERAALAAARRFLAGYLPYSYGQAPAGWLQGAAAPLVRALRRQPPRVPAADRRLAPRLVALEV